MHMEERLEVVQGCKYVTKVVPDAPLIIDEAYLDKHHIDMVFHGHSPEEEEKYRAMYAVPTELGKFKRTQYTTSISTSDIIERIVTRFSK